MSERSLAMAQPELLPATADAPEWGLGKRLGFRLLFSSVVLFGFPFPLGALPWTEKAYDLYQKLLNPMVLWVGENILGIGHPIATGSNGSGDRTYDYVLVVCQLGLAIAATAIWSLIDRRRRHHERLLEALRIYVRVLVGTIMLGYGFAKIFPDGQFVRPSTGDLLKTYAESSPMNLLWTFMGSSTPYKMFAGFMEAIPGALLLFRRTTWAGALLLLGVMGNVVLLNLCYDVPVKLFASQLWLLCLFLAAPAIPRLVSALISGSALPPASAPPPLFVSRRARRAAVSLHVIVVLALVFQMIYPEWKGHVRDTLTAAETAATRSLFTVDEMEVDGQVLPLASGDSRRWTRVAIRRRDIQIQWRDGKREVYRSASQIDGPMKLELTLWSEPDKTRASLDLRKAGDGESYNLEGTFEGAKVRARLKKLDVGQSVLMTRGFHWINEIPYNR